MVVRLIDKLADYVLYIQQNPIEIEVLFKNLLIGVTSFFRNPEAYHVLKEKVLPKLLDGKEPEGALRCWIVGCSTGEEAYSLAILVAEEMEKLGKHLNVQIFATDIDAAAIEVARKGIYPNRIATDVSKERLSRFFTKDAGFFRIKKRIRDMVVFSLHSIIKDPSFSRLDVVSCRNLMIYLDATLQKKIIPMFHYTLNPGGILFLGSSESIGGFTDHYQPIESKWKVFRRKESLIRDISRYPTTFENRDQRRYPSEVPPRMPLKMDIQARIERTILDEYAPSGILINDQYEILHFVGQTDKYLVPPTGLPSFNILNMARQDLKQKLTTAIHKAVREKKRATCKGVQVRFNGGFCLVDISVSPMTDKGFSPGFLLVLFEEKTPEPATDEKPDAEPEGKKQLPEVQQLNQELKSAREYLQATIEEMETSNEELKSSNEEMQSLNEELQSTNEELETSKEELQSTNEELATVNSELQIKVEELSKASDDMNNLLAATELACIFLDTCICIKRYTPAAAWIIKLIRTDIGRPLSDLKTSFPGVDLAEQAGKVLKDLNSVSKEILSEDHIWYALKVMPYRTTENIIGGTVMTFTDISEIKQAGKVRRLANILNDAHDAISVLDLNGRILAWNKGAEKMYGYTEHEAMQMNVADLVRKDRRDEIREIAARLAKGEIIKTFRTRRTTKDGKILDIWLTASALTDENGQSVEIAITERDLAWLPKR